MASVAANSQLHQIAESARQTHMERAQSILDQFLMLMYPYFGFCRVILCNVCEGIGGYFDIIIQKFFPIHRVCSSDS